MAELRQDIVTGTWTVVATERAMRPSEFTRQPKLEPTDPSECPFCPGHEAMTPLEIAAVRDPGSVADSPGWKVRVLPNKFPAFHESTQAGGSEALFQRRPADGSHEVIIHSPEHDESLATMKVEDVAVVLRIYVQRFRRNRRNPDIRYIHVIVNHGDESGASIEHSHSQLFGMPLIPPLVQQELAGASWHRTRKEKCVFCDIIDEELTLGQRVVAQSEGFVAIAPFASRVPLEVWVVPRKHRESFDMITDLELEEFADILHLVLGRYRERLDDPPYNYYIHSCPCDGSDYDYYHWHLEAMPKLTTPGAFELGTSTWINVTTPEHAAEFLR